jgi:hypothetical protein
VIDLFSALDPLHERRQLVGLVAGARIESGWPTTSSAVSP